jgi:hypothetical protein
MRKHHLSPQFYFWVPLRFMRQHDVGRLILGVSVTVLPCIPDVGAGMMVCTIL